VKAVIIVVDAIVYADAVHLHTAAYRDAYGMIGAVGEEDVAYGQVPDLVEEQMVRSAITGEPRGRLRAACGRPELRALAIDRSTSLDRDILGVRGEDERDIAIAHRPFAGQRDGRRSMVLLAIGCSQDLCRGGQVQRHVALQFERSGEKRAGGDQHRAAVVLIA